MANHILIKGVVHGVGFRPFVYALATRLELAGWVCNTSEGVEIYIEGSPSNLDAFMQQLNGSGPQQARIDSMVVQIDESGRGFQTFDILPSVDPGDVIQPLSPDIAICSECERELFDPGSRRYLYPFINCSHCGPRFSIIKDLPYERANTTMADFGMCDNCRAEYDDPLDRRFSAQSLACPECGPFVALREIHSQLPYRSSKISSIECRTAAILKARRLLWDGYILGIKSLGGFHLVCDASNSLTVQELRDRKGRTDKPFAIMASNIDVVRTICNLNPDENVVLTSRERPIVLLEKKLPNGQEHNVSKWVAPNIDTLGVLLPYTALHHLLLNQADPVLATEPSPRLLVMTGGRLADEPITCNDEDALLRLSRLADAFILDNCEIHRSCDNSVVRVNLSLVEKGNHPGPSSRTIYLRRSRGYAPVALKLPYQVKPTLAVGSEFQNAFCLARNQTAFLSPYTGNMENVHTYESFEQSVKFLSHIYNIQPVIIAHDSQTTYFSTQYVRRSAFSAQRIGIQHHHAHIASCMADNNLDDRRVIGLCFDGTGYGTDGAIWGGEILLASYSDFERFAHLEYLPLPGGESASRTPWRIAVGYAQALGLEIEGLPFLQKVDRSAQAILEQQLGCRPAAPLTSCVESLFGAVASLIGIRNWSTYESQASIEMEGLARPFVCLAKSYPYVIETTDQGTVIRLKDLLAAIIQDVRSGRSADMMAARFHKTIAEIAVELCRVSRRATGLNEVALSGVLWQNQILTDLVLKGLKQEGFTVYLHGQVPTNDSGLALGQVMVANHSKELQESSPQA